METDELLNLSSILLRFEAGNREDAIKQLVKLFNNVYPEVRQDSLFEALLKREELGSTGQEGAAIPHVRCEQIHKPRGLLAISEKGVEFNALDGKPIHLLFLMVYPQNPERSYLLTFSMITRLLRNEAIKRSILKAVSPEEVMQIVQSEGALYPLED